MQNLNSTIETVTSSQSNNILPFKSKLELEKLSVKDLQALCTKYGLSKTGNKATIVEKISNYQEKLPAENQINSVNNQENNIMEVCTTSSTPAISQKNEIGFMNINNVQIEVRFKDGYVNATQLGKAMGKEFSNWYQLKSTKELLNELGADLGIPISALVQVTKGGNDKFSQGSWIHPDLVVPMAQWGSPKYAITVSRYMEEMKKENKAIIPLKLTDTFQLTYRQSDGYVNVTNLCKAGDKKFNDWNRLQRTQDFLKELSTVTGYPVTELLQIIQGGNNKNDQGTWAHPQVAINIAQWISPKFDVLVSKWVYEIVLTGKVDVSQQKSSADLLQLQQQLSAAQTLLSQKEKLLLTQAKDLKTLNTASMASKSRHNYYKFQHFKFSQKI